MFVVEVGAAHHDHRAAPADRDPHAATSASRCRSRLWLWFTVVFANFAEAMAEARGKAQADTLRATKKETPARPACATDREEMCSSSDLRKGDVVVVAKDEIIPGDGEVIEGVAYVNEAAITGESAPVLKEPGTDIRSSVTGGTQVISDTLRIQISADPGETFLDRMIALVEGAERQKTPNEIALSILLAGLTIIFLLAVATLVPFAIYAGTPVSTVILIALLVCLIPTTIGGLLSAIGIAGMDRVTRFNVLAMSGRAVEAAGDIDVLLLDKTGTITFGNRLAAEIIPVGGANKLDALICARQSSLGDETPEGRSIQALAEQLGAPAADGLALRRRGHPVQGRDAHERRAPGRPRLLQGRGRRHRRRLRRQRSAPAGPRTSTSSASRGEGGTPLALLMDNRIVGVVYLKDTVKPGMRQRFDEFRRMGIRTIMITGDNPLTAATIAAGGRRGRFRRPGQARGQDPHHPRAAGRGPPGGHDRRRHQRRAGPGSGGRRPGDELGHGGGQGSRQHGRPGLQSDQADRGGGDRQAAAHHPRRDHHVLDRQRRGQVLRHHPGRVRGDLSRS